MTGRGAAAPPLRLATTLAIVIVALGSAPPIAAQATTVTLQGTITGSDGSAPDGEGGTVAGDPLHLTTGSLPPDLPRYSAGGTDPSPGYVVFAAGRYGLVIDNTGRVVWYRHFPDGAGLNFMAQPTGRYVRRPPDAGARRYGALGRARCVRQRHAHAELRVRPAVTPARHHPRG